jgi:sugar diacid utilization regulator
MAPRASFFAIVSTRAAPGQAATRARGVALSDLLALPALAGASLVAGGAGPQTRMERLVLDDPDAPPEPGALVAVPGAPPDPLPNGCAAVVCRRPPATELAVPVVVLPAGAPWGPVLADLAAALAGAGRLRPAAAARVALRAPLLRGGGHGGLALAVRDLLGAPVACLDEYLDLLGGAGLGEAQEAELDEMVAEARGHGPASVLGSFLNHETPGLARVPVVGANGPVGVVVAWLPDELEPAERGVLEELAEACAVERARDEARIETEARLRGDLLEELLAGEAVSRESLVRRARHLGADLSRGAVALIGKLQDPHTDGRVITDERLVRRFLQQARASLDLHWPRSLVDWQDGELMALLPPPPRPGEEGTEAIEAQAMTLARRLLAATRQTVPGLALTIALSRHTAEPERLGAALDEARLALSIGERLGRLGEVVTFEETGTYKLLFQIFADRPAELDGFYEQTLAPLVRYDEQYSTELVATLATYLENDCNLAATAGTLFTHRHTVRYRLDRIAELSGLDIGRTDDREKLSLGLKAMRLLGRRVVSPSGERPGRGRG